MPSRTENTRSGSKRTLSNVVTERANNLMEKWSYRNRNRVWLGHASREMMRDELEAELRWFYDAAKKKYSSSE